MVTRTSYCKDCAKENRPAYKDLFAVYGGTRKRYIVKMALAENMTVGYTPHFFIPHKVENGHITYKKVCGMSGCGVSLQPKDEKSFNITFIKESYSIMTIKNWNALLKTSDYGYKID